METRFVKARRVVSVMMMALIMAIMPLTANAMTLTQTTIKDINSGNVFYFTCTNIAVSSFAFKDEAGAGAWCEAVVSVYDTKNNKCVVKNKNINTRTGEKTVFIKYLGKGHKYKVVVSKVVKYNNINNSVKLIGKAVGGKFTKN